MTFPLPARLVEHALAFAEAGHEPPPARLASTVVLMRPSAADGDGFEVYAIRRAATMAFAADMYAFPGGAVDPRDFTVELGWAGPAPAEWAARLGLSEATARAVLCAAVREVFEESGVLLAGPDRATVVGDVSGDEWEAARVALIDRTVGFAEFLAERGLMPRTDLLAPWARWVTPDFEPRRYDTYFFLALLPGGQRTRDVGGEAAHTRWAPPAVLAGDGTPMLPPTQVTLRQIAHHPTIEAVLAAAAVREPGRPVQPKAELQPDGSALLVVPL